MRLLLPTCHGFPTASLHNWFRGRLFAKMDAAISPILVLRSLCNMITIKRVESISPNLEFGMALWYFWVIEWSRMTLRLDFVKTYSFLFHSLGPSYPVRRSQGACWQLCEWQLRHRSRQLLVTSGLPGYPGQAGPWLTSQLAADARQTLAKTKWNKNELPQFSITRLANPQHCEQIIGSNFKPLCFEVICYAVKDNWYRY